MTIGGIKKSGVIILEESSTEPLLGMDFIRTFELSLVVTDDKVALFDKEAIERASRDAGSDPPSPSS